MIRSGAAASSWRVSGGGGKPGQLLQSMERGSAEPPCQLQDFPRSAWASPGHLPEQPVERIRRLSDNLQPVRDELSAQTTHLDLPRIIEVIDTMGVRRVAVSFKRSQPVTNSPEMSPPGRQNRIQESPSAGRLSAVRPGSVAVAASIQAVRVVIPPPWIRAPRNVMLDACHAEAVGGTPARQIRLVDKTERTGEAKIPTQAGPIRLVAFLAVGRRWFVSTSCRMPGRQGHGRQDLHGSFSTVGPAPKSRRQLPAASAVLSQKFASVGWLPESAESAAC